MLKYLNYVIVFLCLISCSGKNIRIVLDDVQSFIEDRPDSALKILQSINPEDIENESNMAKYSLLYSMALDKNHVYLTKDSIISPAVNYYKKHGSDLQKALSLYYSGRVKQNSGNYYLAVVSFSLAEVYAEKSSSIFYLGLIHRALGDIFSDTYNSSESLKYYKYAYSDFVKSKESNHIDYSLFDIARAYNNCAMYDEFEENITQTLDVAKSKNDTVLYAESLKLYASALSNIKTPADYNSTIRVYDYITDSLKYALTFDDYIIMANAYSKSGDIKNAEGIINALRVYANHNKHNESKLCYSEYLLNSRSNNYKTALECFEKTTFYQDSLMRHIMQQSLISVQRDLLTKQIESDSERLEAKDRTLYISIIFSFIIILLLIYIFYRKVKIHEKKNLEFVSQINKAMIQVQETAKLLNKKEHIISELHSDLENAVNSEKEYKTSLNTLYSSLQNMYNSRLNNLDQLCNEYYAYGRTTARYRRIFKQAELFVKSLSVDAEYQLIESMVNLSKDGIMSKARCELLSLKEDDFRLLCYLYAGFSPSTICLLLNYEKVDIVYTKKYRLKRKIEQTDAEFKMMYIDELG